MFSTLPWSSQTRSLFSRVLRQRNSKGRTFFGFAWFAFVNQTTGRHQKEPCPSEPDMQCSGSREARHLRESSDVSAMGARSDGKGCMLDLQRCCASQNLQTFANGDFTRGPDTSFSCFPGDLEMREVCKLLARTHASAKANKHIPSPSLPERTEQKSPTRHTRPSPELRQPCPQTNTLSPPRPTKPPPSTQNQ